MASQFSGHRGIRGIQQQLIPLFAAAPLVEPKGVVYTRRWVVDLILDLTGYAADQNLIDAVAVEPAAGNGAFLGSMIERLVECCRRGQRPITDCRNSLVAFELSDESAAHARRLAASILMERAAVGRELADELAAGWVRRGDFLLETSRIEADFVIGNPPYVRLEEIPEETAETYRRVYSTMCGRADLYVAFFEAALGHLKPDGVCGFICADRWMRNQYGAELRELITSGYAVDVIVEMHEANAFDDEVDAYPAITIIRRNRQLSTVVASFASNESVVDSSALSRALRSVTENNARLGPAGLHTARVEKWFMGKDPWPCHSPEQLALLRRLEDRFPALESAARVGIGVATGNDSVFITDDPNLVERSRLLELCVGKDISGGELAWSGHYLVDPWNEKGLVDLAKYPRLRGYFERNYDALKRRHTAARNASGWYRTIDRVQHQLRTTPKLYIADIKDSLEPVLDRGETYPHHNLYFITSERWDLEVLGGLLLSAAGQFFVESYGVRMRGGYLRFQAQYLRRIRVPALESITDDQSAILIDAFRRRDRHAATEVALAVYGIGKDELETAIGH